MQFIRPPVRRARVRPVGSTFTHRATTTQHAARAFAFDLDGTLVQCNSMRIWARHLLRTTAPGVTVAQGARVLGWKAVVCAVGALRAARIISQGAAKRTLQRLSEKLAAVLSAEDLLAHEQALVQELMSYVRPDLTFIIARIREGAEPMILTTATVSNCAEPLGAALGFDCVCATRHGKDDGQWLHNIGALKATATLEAAAKLGAGDAPLVVFVDQLDDLPLIMCAETVCWFGRKEEVPRLKSFLQPGVSVIEARDMPVDALAEALGLAPQPPAQVKPSVRPVRVLRGGGSAAALRPQGE